MGIINGDGNGNFNPSGNITRAEFIKLLITTFALPETLIGSFKDVTPNDWYHRYIMTRIPVQNNRARQQRQVLSLISR